MSVGKDFSCIGGLEKHIKIVKEMVLFPLMYGDIYAKFNLRPPRGLLFYGPPGTGKTLIASALAVECSNADRKVSFIARKGSDCWSKYVGEGERKLQKIFNTAQQSKPCIIFFDEVDGLAPVRSSRQEFVHTSMVSTLLALMDGLDNNSEVIVIGATNRLDAIDPALRRPGRFDRELYFPLPCYSARKEILSVHVRNWKQKPPLKFLAYLASKTVGFCGSDLQALCAEAVMCCIRRHYPQIYTSRSKYHINERSIKIEKQDFIKAQESIVPASHRITVIPVKRLSPKIYPLHYDNLCAIINRLQGICPVGMINSEATTNIDASKSTMCPRLLLCGEDDCHTRHLAPAVLHSLEHLPFHILDVTALFEETGRAVEETIIQVEGYKPRGLNDLQKVKAARHTLPALLYVPDIFAWWDLVDETARTVFTSLMKGLDRSVHLLVLTTIQSSVANVPTEILELFDEHQGEVYEISSPASKERLSFFQQLFLKSRNLHSSDISNRSSYLDFSKVQEVKDSRTEVKRIKEIIEIKDQPVSKRTRSEAKARTKLSMNSQSAGSNQKIPSKREHSLSDVSIASKRPRLSSTFSLEKLTNPQVQDLLNRIVESTDNWPSQQIEILYASLQVIHERSGNNVYAELNECLATFFKRSRAHRRSDKV